MIKTYNLVRYHTGDRLAEIVVSYVTPRCFRWDAIIEAGSGELVAMLDPEEYHVAVMHLLGDNEPELASIVIKLDNGRAISPEDIARYIQSGKENELVRAVKLNDFIRARSAIRNGARDFNSIYDSILKPETDTKISGMISWCREERDDDLILLGCESDVEW